MQLNKAQMEAATHREGPLLVLAAPGSGKTSVICSRVHYLIESAGVLPERICVLTFTREAAGTMQQRINQKKFYPVCLGTIHSLCYQILSQHSVLKSKKLLLSSQRRELIHRILQEQNRNDKNYFACAEEIDEVSNSFTKLASGIFTALDPDPQSDYGLYQKRKKELGFLDFDDLLLTTWNLLLKNENIRIYWQNRFDHYLVDEFQDLNEIQFQILKILAGKHENIMAVGDDDQSIYGFRGSSPLVLKQFQNSYPSCRCLFLDRNYRCADSIIQLSVRSIEQNRDRFAKQICGNGKKDGLVICRRFENQKEQALFTLEMIIKFNQELINNRKDEKEKHTAVLFRTRRQKEEFCALLEAETEDVERTCLDMQLFVLQDLKHYLSLFRNPNELQDLLAVMNHPDRGLSRMFMPVEDFSLSSWEMFCKKCRENEQAKRVQQFRIQLENTAAFGPDPGIRYFVKACGYEEYIINKFNKNGGEENVLKKSFDILLEEIHSLNWREFEKKLNLKLININEKMNKKDEIKRMEEVYGVSFLTMHAAKGLEFETVFLPNLTEGVFPSGKSVNEGELEQERRLFYVAMTRAKRNLIFTYVEPEGQKKKSRFLSELGF